MRIRTILAAAAAPAALAAVLLGTAGQASAAVVSPQASMSASVQKRTSTGKVSQTGVPDTTNVDTTLAGNATENNNSDLYGPIGPVWSHDDITRNIQVSPGPVAGQWTVSFVENGKYHAIADPNTGLKWLNDGNMHGTISYTVQSALPPAMDKLDAINGPAVVNGSVHGHGYILDQLFPGAPIVSYGPYSYQYTQIQDVSGIFKQVG